MTFLRGLGSLAGAIALLTLVAATDCNPSNGPSDGGNHDAKANPCAIPTCFLNVFTDCQGTQICTRESQVMTGNSTVNVCYDSGVKWQTKSTFSGAAIMSTITAYKTDQSVCFTAEGMTSTSMGSTSTYKDSGGNTLVTVTITPQGTMTYACGDKTYSIDQMSCPKEDAGVIECTMGSCSVP